MKPNTIKKSRPTSTEKRPIYCAINLIFGAIFEKFGVCKNWRHCLRHLPQNGSRLCSGKRRAAVDQWLGDTGRSNLHNLGTIYMCVFYIRPKYTTSHGTCKSCFEINIFILNLLRSIIGNCIGGMLSRRDWGGIVKLFCKAEQICNILLQ